jgi:hypothetical protein
MFPSRKVTLPLENEDGALKDAATLLRRLNPLRLEKLFAPAGSRSQACGDKAFTFY